MNTLIIPCAGKSSRFPDMRPKWLLNYPDGKLMVEKAVEGLDVEDFDRIIITIVREHVDKYSADKKLEKAFHSLLLQSSVLDKLEICVLENFTSCQAETVFQTKTDKLF